jgi:peptidyl-prolyl cis-trans isomerase A (cyclophilin A)
VSRRFHSRDVSPTSRPRRAAPEQPAPNLLEALEGRVLMHEGPLKVHSVVADNRGEVLISMNQAIRASNVNTGSIQMYTAGPDNVLGTRDDTRVTTQLNYQPTGARVVIRSELPAGTGYRVKLVSARIGSADGHEKLDGEFNGSYPSGNGVAGGNFEFQVKNDKTKTPLVRMSTEEGAVTLLLRGDAAPQTVNNFLGYANGGDYDNTFVTRSVPGFVLQMGSLQVNNKDQIVAGPVRAPVVNEFNISNTRGSIAMAKQAGDPNSATNQFFFNLGDNSQSLDMQNGGFTVFAQVTSAQGLAVMDALASHDVVALRNPASGAGVIPAALGGATDVTDVPVFDARAVSGDEQNVAPAGQRPKNRLVVTGAFSPTDDLILIRRVATLMRVVRL